MVSQPARNRALTGDSEESPASTARELAQAERVHDATPPAPPAETPPKPAATVVAVTAPPPEKLVTEIREKAFYRYEERSRQGKTGDEVDDWLNAERDVVDRWHSPLEDLAPPRWDDSPRRNWKK